MMTFFPSSLQHWAKIIRLEEWFSVTFLPLLSTTYFLLLIEGEPFGQHIWNASLIAVFGLLCGSFAFVINSLFDIDQDRRAGKIYATTHWSRRRMNVLLAILTVLSIVVLMIHAAELRLVFYNEGAQARLELSVRSRQFLAVTSSLETSVSSNALDALLESAPYRDDAPVLVLATLTYFLALVYSAPPLRLKERGLGGPLTIAVSEFALPQAIMFAAFERYDWGMVLFTALFLVVGLRMILMHQLLDFGNDLAGDVNTFVTLWGSERVCWLVMVVLVPVEVGILCPTLLFVNTWVAGTLVFSVACLAVFYLYDRLQRQLEMVSLPAYFTAPFDFYLLLWPLFLLGIGLVQSRVFLVLLGLHVWIARPHWTPHLNSFRLLARRLIHCRRSPN
jgi:4-hydroxybenzoate polyprenyltransferase